MMNDPRIFGPRGDETLDEAIARQHRRLCGRALPAEELKPLLAAALKELGVTCAGYTESDSRRWSGTDLATDLAPILAEVMLKRHGG